MSEPYIGQIAIFGFNFAPQNWVFCNGGLMSISQNTAFYSVIGTYYGGNGIQTFAVPNIQNCGVVGWGQGPGLSNYVIGEPIGEPEVTLNVMQLPAHNHLANGIASKANTDYVPGVQNGYWMGQEARSASLFGTATDGTTLASQTIGLQGGSQPHMNQQPFLGMNFCIAQYGIFPTRS
jgi:microcystin-dependent protein